jgi:hypothetical protein
MLAASMMSRARLRISMLSNSFAPVEAEYPAVPSCGLPVGCGIAVNEIAAPTAESAPST